MRKKIDINMLQEGHSYKSSIYMGHKDNVLIPAYTKIKKADINLMQKWNIDNLEYDDEIDEFELLGIDTNALSTEDEDIVSNNSENKNDDLTLEHTEDDIMNDLKEMHDQIDTGHHTEHHEQPETFTDQKERSISEKKNKLANMMMDFSDDLNEIDQKMNDTSHTNNETYKILKEYMRLLTSLNSLFNNIKLKKNVEKKAVDGIVDSIFKIVKDNKSEILNIVYNYTDTDLSYVVIHSINVAVLSACIGFTMDLNNFKILKLIKAAMFHDVGMVRIPNHILEKKGKLTDREFKYIKNHTVLGYKLLNGMEGFTQEESTVALQHHERHNGSGYPAQTTGEKISLYAKIVAIADSYDAMTHSRSYKVKSLSHVSMKNILAASNNLYDPKVLKAFLSLMSIYPIGSIVQLNNSSIGIVVRSNQKLPLRPVIRLLVDEFGDKVEDREELQLEENPNLFITSTLNIDDIEFSLEDFL